MFQRIEQVAALIGGDLKTPEFKIRDTKFRVAKLLAEEGFEVLEILRPAIVAMVARMPSTVTDEAMILTALAGLSSATRQEIQDRLFVQVWWSTKKSPTEKPLAGAGGEPWEGLEPVHIYGVIAKALFVNFTGSFSVARSLFAPLIQAASPPSPSGTSTPSSPAR